MFLTNKNLFIIEVHLLYEFMYIQPFFDVGYYVVRFAFHIFVGEKELEEDL